MHFGQGVGAGELGAVGVGSKSEMVVRIDETGKDHAAAEADHLGAFVGHGVDVGVRSHGEDAPVGDCDRLRLWSGRIDSMDLGVPEDQVGSWA